MDTLTLKNKGRKFQERKKARLVELSYCDLPLDIFRWQNVKEKSGKIRAVNQNGKAIYSFYWV